MYTSEAGYLELIRDILANGTASGDRTGTGTIKVFGRMLRFDLNDGFPLLTTKKVFWKGVLHELLWFVRGDTNIRYLVQNDVNIWTANAFDAYLKRTHQENLCAKGSQAWEEQLKWYTEEIKSDAEFAARQGDLGPVYGKQWRNFNSVDQLAWVIDEIRRNPNSRRLLISAWNPPEIPAMALPPCHYAFQFQVDEGSLSCLVNIRSWDVFLGGPFNIASYAFLTHMVAKMTGLAVKELIISSGDTHLYQDHLEQVELQLSRTPFPFPVLTLAGSSDKAIDEFQFSDFEIIGYQSHTGIKARMSV